MALLGLEEARHLRRYLAARLTADVRVDCYPRTGPPRPGAAKRPGDQPLRALLAEVAALDPRIRLHLHEDGRAAAGFDERPAAVLTGAARGQVRFLGTPAGYEFPCLIEALCDVASGVADLAPSSRRILDDLARDLRVRVFVTPMCTFCAPLSRLAHKVGVASPRVTAEVVAVGEFPHLAREFGVRGVPTVALGDHLVFAGACSEERFLERLGRAALSG